MLLQRREFPTSLSKQAVWKMQERNGTEDEAELKLKKLRKEKKPRESFGPHIHPPANRKTAV
jgi:hypothetical protein